MSRRLPLIGLVLVSLSVSAAVVFVLSRRETPRERFIAEATAICEASKRDVEVAFNAQLGSDATPEQIAGFLSGPLATQLRDRLDRLEALELPPDDEDELAGLFADYRAVVEAVAADPARFVTEDDPFAAVDTRFDDHGLAACGSAPPE
ncbi:MAG: hypothetical protein ACRD0A_05300 [Acidimicrobiales bacterium]